MDIKVCRTNRTAACSISLQTQHTRYRNWVDVGTNYLDLSAWKAQQTQRGANTMPHNSFTNDITHTYYTQQIMLATCS